MIIQTIDEFLETPDPPSVWVCNPYIAQAGITFLHGRSSLGKSPLTWEMARCVSLGEPFLGQFEVTRQRVLYVEADTAGPLLRPRLRLLSDPKGDWQIACAYSEGIDLAEPSPKAIALFKDMATAKPTLIFWNTLRALTSANLSDGETTASVYHTLRHYFPGVAHFLVHHDRKMSTHDGATRMPDEEFSGSNAWRDTAQVGLHLMSGREGGENCLLLVHTKTQVSAKIPTLKLTLASDGTSWLLHDREAAFQVAYDQAISPDRSAGSKEHRVEVMRELNIKESAFYAHQARLRSTHSAPLIKEGQRGVVGWSA